MSALVPDAPNTSGRVQEREWEPQNDPEVVEAAVKNLEATPPIRSGPRMGEKGSRGLNTQPDAYSHKDKALMSKEERAEHDERVAAAKEWLGR